MFKPAADKVSSVVDPSPARKVPCVQAFLPGAPTFPSGKPPCASVSLSSHFSPTSPQLSPAEFREWFAERIRKGSEEARELVSKGAVGPAIAALVASFGTAGPAGAVDYSPEAFPLLWKALSSPKPPPSPCTTPP